MTDNPFTKTILLSDVAWAKTALPIKIWSIRMNIIVVDLFQVLPMKVNDDGIVTTDKTVGTLYK